MPPELTSLKWKPGQAVYFHFVHLQKAQYCGKSASIDGRNLEVEGKSRRMLILGKCWWCDVSTIATTGTATGPNGCSVYRAKGRPGYLLVELQTSCPRGLEKWYSEPHIGLLEKGKPTVISYMPTVYPAECCADSARANPKCVNDNVFNEVIKELNLRGLGKGLFDPHTMPQNPG